MASTEKKKKKRYDMVIAEGVDGVLSASLAASRSVSSVMMSYSFEYFLH